VSKTFADSAGFTDVLIILRAKLFSDSGSFGDDHSADFHKFINEALGVTDDLDGEATAEDDQEMSFVKVRSDLATAVDLFAIQQAKIKSDTIAATDGGSLLGQGYVEVGYFLEDYVGYSRTF
jgi:hypothetical protein